MRKQTSVQNKFGLLKVQKASFSSTNENEEGSVEKVEEAATETADQAFESTEVAQNDSNNKRQYSRPGDKDYVEKSFIPKPQGLSKESEQLSFKSQMFSLKADSTTIQLENLRALAQKS